MSGEDTAIFARVKRMILDLTYDASTCDPDIYSLDEVLVKHSSLCDSIRHDIEILKGER